MKIRTKFVSNSSSSSFTITTNGLILTEALLQSELFADLPDTPGMHLIKPFIERIIGVFMRAEKVESYEYEEHSPRVKEDIDAGKTVYTGYADSDGDVYEAVICEMDIDFSSDKLAIRKGAGY